MNEIRIKAALFDLDGVVIDTESQYTVFWDSMGLKYLNAENFGHDIKGQSLTRIFDCYFSHIKEKQQEIKKQLDDFEAQMKMPFVPGFVEFVTELRQQNCKVAVVTSSDKPKMESVYRNHPEMPTMFDRILTAELFARSKPFPDPYLLGAKVFDLSVENCVVFEDSFNGLKSGRAAGMKVIGLSTTNPEAEIAPLCDVVISDYVKFSYDKMCKILA